ncbi:restriction endonuclease subunit S [Lactobacillus helveticus]|uniref:restriction endonuclease subunit S n=1 Tax=Lactobacillus helveticus TaxID=1587 RepID=UPI0013FE3562|nr:restriction endonuclease subunit S [Lactobacillus helveticus]
MSFKFGIALLLFTFFVWEDRKLGELSNIVGGGTPSTSNPEYWDGDIDWYAPAEIGEQSYVSKSKKTITELGLKKSSARILPVGTVLFTSRAGIGNTAILAKEATTNQGFQSIVPDQNKLDSYFIFSRTNELKRYGEVTGAGSTFVEISGKQMSKMPIMVPELSEQQKIGSFFKQLDNTITLHQRKLKLLKVMKKALSQYMFCQETEFVPILRFNSFSDKWKYERLKKLIIKEIKGKAKADMKGTKSTYIDTALLNGGSITKVDSPTDTFHNDIIILWDGSQAGKIYHGFTGALGSTLKSYKPKYSGGFLYQYLKSKEPIIFLRYRTPNIPHVVKDFTEIFKINVPSVKEQEKISKTLNYLDQSILVETKKIGSIKKIKKFLLQNMFI